jgi:hypothetical protein
VQSYVQTQEDLSAVSGNPIASNAVGGSTLPAGAPADTLFVLDNCSALYLSNGERYDPWIPVSLASPFNQDFSVRFTRRTQTLQQVALVRMGRNVQSAVYLDYDGSQMRVVFSDPLFFTTSFWTTVTPGERYDIDVAADIPRQSLTVSLNGHPAVQSLMSSGELAITRYSGAALHTRGKAFEITSRPVAKSPLCTHLVALRPSLSAAPAAAPTP